MEANITSRYSVDIPKGDVALFRSMTRRMGWNVKRLPTNAQPEFNETTKRALKDVREGKILKAKSVADLMAQLNC